MEYEKNSLFSIGGKFYAYKHAYKIHMKESKCALLIAHTY